MKSRMKYFIIAILLLIYLGFIYALLCVNPMANKTIIKKPDIFVFYLTVFRNDSAVITDFRPDSGVPMEPENRTEANYSIVLLSKDNQMLHEDYINLYFYRHISVLNNKTGEISGKVEEKDFSGIYLKIPHFFEAKNLQVRHNGKAMLNYEIAEKDTFIPVTSKDLRYSGPCSNPEGQALLFIILFIPPLIVYSLWKISRTFMPKLKYKSN